MADQSDVEAALVNLAAAALYPLGTQAAASVTGAVLRIYRGWPANAALEADLARGICHVSVGAVPGPAAELEQFPAVWEYPDPVIPALWAATAGTTVSFGGIAAPGQLAGMLVDDDGFAYRTRAGDTPELVAANLAALVNQIRIATVAGAAVSVVSATRLIGRVVADQAALMPIRRQRGTFRITCWCADAGGRDATASAIDARFAATPFVALADGGVGRLRYAGSEPADDLVPLPLYRRQLTYSVDYATTVAQTQPSMLFGIFAVDQASGASTLHLS